MFLYNQYVYVKQEDQSNKDNENNTQKSNSKVVVWLVNFDETYSGYS